MTVQAKTANLNSQGILRKASLEDVPGIFQLVEHYAHKQILLPRSELEISEHIREFSVYDLDGQVLACAALRIFGSQLGEIRSVAVNPEVQGQGLGRRLMNFVSQEAYDLGLPKVFVLTYEERFFMSLGFEAVQKQLLPQKIWTDCVFCPKFDNCTEVAMVKIL